MASTTIAAVLHSTLTKSRKKLILASIKSNALQAWAFATNRVEYEDGGHEITNPLTIGRNPNVTSYEYYDTLPMAQTDEFTTATYDWSRVAGSLIISDQEQDENTGRAQIFKLLKAKMSVLEESIKEQFSTYLYGAGPGKDPLGLAAIIPDDPTVGTLGGISRVAETQWRTSSYDFLGTLDQTNVEEAFDDVMLDLTMKGEKPDIIIAGRNIMRVYRAAARDKITFALSDTKNGSRMVDLGFGGVSFNNVPMVYDEDCNVDKAYFINSKFLRLHILKHVNMKLKSLAAPWTQDAIGKRVVWQGQWCSWKAYRTHATVKR
ncbi:MAG: hypothetical protein BMS9Abin11_1791 [Gammaproteobacteria bacterium]|nr:MAG: hypothetical protein BMS9Abin11_1791 [Gammaproteobacteria bacterium]